MVAVPNGWVHTVEAQADALLLPRCLVLFGTPVKNPRVLPTHLTTEGLQTGTRTAYMGLQLGPRQRGGCAKTVVRARERQSEHHQSLAENASRVGRECCDFAKLSSVRRLIRVSTNVSHDEDRNKQSRDRNRIAQKYLIGGRDKERSRVRDPA